MRKKFNRNTFFYATLIVIASGFIVKLLGLVNKIAITRVLGTEGMSLYVLSFPTIMLFVSLSGMSLYVTMSKLVSEAMINRKYSPRNLLKSAFKISMIVSFFTCLLYIILLKPLTHYFLKNDALYAPLLTGLVLIPLVGMSDGLKGYFNGLKQSTIATAGNLAEQIGRIGFSITFLFIMIPYGTTIATVFCLLALSFGEICAIVFCLIKLKKYLPAHFEHTENETKAILSMSIPNTFSRLLGNFTYFLEPIIYTGVLSYLGYSLYAIHQTYTIIDAYTIPLLTFFSFLPFAISNTIVPGVSIAATKHNSTSITYYIQKALLFCAIPALILLINLFYFSKDYMHLIYRTTEGTEYISFLCFLFLFYYIDIPLVSILQALGKSKQLFISSTIIHILRLLLIVIFSCIPSLGLYSILFASTATLIIGTVIHFIQIKKYTGYTPSIERLCYLLITFLLTFLLMVVLHKLGIHYLLILFATASCMTILSIAFKLIWIESLFSKLKFKRSSKS